MIQFNTGIPDFDSLILPEGFGYCQLRHHHEDGDVLLYMGGGRSFRVSESTRWRYAKEGQVMRTAWIPEAPNHPGLYANASGRDMEPGGKIRTAELPRSTISTNAARKFATREECQRWCDENPVPVFVPREHGFYD